MQRIRSADLEETVETGRDGRAEERSPRGSVVSVNGGNVEP